MFQAKCSELEVIHQMMDLGFDFQSNIYQKKNYKTSTSQPTTSFFMKKGTIKFYSKEQQYGFIAPEAGGKEVYLPKSAFQEGLQAGSKVMYALEEDRKGLVAHQVILQN